MSKKVTPDKHDYDPDDYNSLAELLHRNKQISEEVEAEASSSSKSIERPIIHCGTYQNQQTAYKTPIQSNNLNSFCSFLYVDVVKPKPSRDDVPPKPSRNDVPPLPGPMITADQSPPTSDLTVPITFLPKGFMTEEKACTNHHHSWSSQTVDPPITQEEVDSRNFLEYARKLKDFYHQCQLNVALRDSPELPDLCNINSTQVNNQVESQVNSQAETQANDTVQAESQADNIVQAETQANDTVQVETQADTPTQADTQVESQDVNTQSDKTKSDTQSDTLLTQQDGEAMCSSSSSNNVTNRNKSNRDTSPPYSTMEENLAIVPTNLWNDAIQDHVSNIDDLKTKTLRLNFPKLWIIADMYATVWKKHGWHGPNKGSGNVTNFKNKIVNRIVTQRRPEALCRNADLVQSILEVRTKKSVEEEKAELESHGEIYVYEKEVFIDYALRTYRKSPVAQLDSEADYTVNDIIRLVSVMSLNQHRSDLLSLSSGKSKARRDIDYPESKEMQFFGRVAADYNDEKVVVEMPPGANRLDSVKQMNPNDKTRIDLGRSPLYLKNLYKKIILGEYRRATHKWRKGTGGGPGAPENFHNWNQRDAKLFANYGGGKQGVRVKKDYLAYILMADIKCSYAFSSRFAPAPKDAVLEDGDKEIIEGNEEMQEFQELTSPNKKPRKGGTSAMENMGLNICGTIERINDKLTDAFMKFNAANTVQDTHNATDGTAVDVALTVKMKQLNDSMKLCDDLEARVQRLVALPDDDPTKEMKLQATRNAHMEALNIMNNLTKKKGNESAGGTGTGE